MKNWLHLVFTGLVCLLGLMFHPVAAQVAPTFAWVTAGGGNGDTDGQLVKLDAAGNTYAAGYFTNTTTFQGTTLRSRGGRDVFLAKYDVQGHLLWVRQLGGAGEEQIISLAIDTSDEVVLAGQFTSGVAPVPALILTIGGFTLQAATAKGELFLAKFDALGTALWARQSRSPDGFYVLDLVLNRSGDIYLSAMLTGFSGTTAQLDQVTVHDFFLAKYSGSGTIAWVKQDLGQVGRIAVDATGDLYLYGSSYSQLSLTFNSLTLSAGGKPFRYFGRFDAVGNVRWAQVLDAPSSHWLSCMVVAPNHDLLIGLDFGGTVTRGQQTFTASGQEDLLLLCYSPQGTLRWAQQLGGPSPMSGADQLAGPALDATGNSYLFVRLEGMATLTLPSSAAGISYRLVSYSPTGALRWERLIPSYVNSLAATATGELALTNWFTQPLAFDSLRLPSSGYFNAYVARLRALPGVVPYVEPAASASEALPNIITPNNDGLNDRFVVPSLASGPCQVRIYSRWGREVYRSEDYQQDWAALGQPAGLYYYLLQLPGQLLRKGWVEVVR